MAGWPAGSSLAQTIPALGFPCWGSPSMGFPPFIRSFFSHRVPQLTESSQRDKVRNNWPTSQGSERATRAASAYGSGQQRLSMPRNCPGRYQGRPPPLICLWRLLLPQTAPSSHVVKGGGRWVLRPLRGAIAVTH